MAQKLISLTIQDSITSNGSDVFMLHQGSGQHCILFYLPKAIFHVDTVMSNSQPNYQLYWADRDATEKLHEAHTKSVHYFHQGNHVQCGRTASTASLHIEPDKVAEYQGGDVVTLTIAVQ